MDVPLAALYLSPALKAGVSLILTSVAMVGGTTESTARVNNDGHPFPYALITGDLIYAIYLIAGSLNAVQIISCWAAISGESNWPHVTIASSLPRNDRPLIVP